MPKIACVMMQKNETLLLRPWLAYHGYLFGFENLYVLDNGSDSGDVRATLEEFAGKGVHVDWTPASRQHYLAKGELIGARMQALDATRDYDFLIPIDCDEFVLLRTETDFVCSREAILTYLVTLMGEKRVLRMPYQFANHPFNPDIYHYYEFFKVFFAAGTVSPIDHGNHESRGRSGLEPKDTRLVQLHFHHKIFDLKVSEARQSWIGFADLENRAQLEAYNGRSWHLKQFFLRDKAYYYRGFLDRPHVFIPRFRALLNELGAPLDLPTEQVPDHLTLRVSEVDPSSNADENGVLIIVPTRRTGSGPAEFRAMRFHEGHYSEANPDLISAGIDPTVHFCIDGWKENRAPRPTENASHGFTPAVRDMIAAYVARTRPATRDGEPRCLELGSGGGPRPAGWLATDLDPTAEALKLDVTTPFPIDDATFDHIYARHLIEHLPFAGACFMLRECFRVLKPGGTIRIVTASIEFLFGLFSPRQSAATDRYIQWVTETFVPAAPKPMASFVFNHFVRGQGRQFIYDRATLELVLREAGFAGVHDRDLNHSDHVRLRGLESGSGFPEMESMIMEATRPATGMGIS